MKLYNLYNEVILEETENALRLLTEGVSEDEVKKAIDGKYNVNIVYKTSDDSQPTNRYIQVYNLGVTKKKEGGVGGNPAIRAYQIFGGSDTSSNGWKIFRLDKIQRWSPTNMKWKNPVSDTNVGIPDYNHTGDKTMASVTHNVDVSQFGSERGHTYEKPNNNDLNNKI